MKESTYKPTDCDPWALRGALAVCLIACVRAYQWLIRPILPVTCRFEPSCSQYFILAVEKYGPVRGALKGFRRITRCHPWNKCGYDPP
jgi:putative membrane protein insertion efficiency factor